MNLTLEQIEKLKDDLETFESIDKDTVIKYLDYIIDLKKALSELP